MTYPLVTECVWCGAPKPRSPMNKACEDCEWRWKQTRIGPELDSLGFNLSIAAALTRAFGMGYEHGEDIFWDTGFDWTPGCGREAP